MDINVRAKHQFGTTYYKVRSKLIKELEAAGYYEQAYVKIFKTFRWPLFCFAILAAGILLIIFQGLIFIGICLILISIFLFIYSFLTAPLSKFGQEIHDQLKGLEKFLKNPDDSRIQEILHEDPDYFGKMLPFTVALGFDKQWIKSFEPIYDTAPGWYETYHIYHYPHHRPTFSDFSSSFQVKEITSAFTSLPQSSSGGGSSSGFSSGGFSGGGFGGGGGGSW